MNAGKHFKSGRHRFAAIRAHRSGQSWYDSISLRVASSTTKAKVAAKPSQRNEASS